MAWEAHSLSVLTEGRFEMGIGTGRPGIEDELALHVPVVGDAVAPFMTPPTRTRPRYARRTRS
jgi:alkanesulfonate monooxygenase SsuD/methylene tetrahydromethanopterin reductase-like flavin-dependent oxidoreductase (luciferase family)